ncbi:DNA polymerase III subunit beta [Paenibacillus tritici]|uniref:Beta sliding clamp n=1 Tax=Paenibacillus tritici TaxID=1873425 RepID=A0ABX2DHA9_9BACL|nr:DNA polymerase III subunit beta [Paenibacillus tritici]
MQVNITKDSLLKALQQVLKAVPANNLISKLAGVHIHAHANAMVVTTSNSSMTIQYRIPEGYTSLKVQRIGEVVVPARYFYEIIRKSDSGFITLEVERYLMLTISSGHTRIRLCGMDAADYPKVHTIESHPLLKLRINNALLKTSIKQVACAASTSEHRPVLTGISFKYSNQELNLMATDGVRLASRTLNIDHEADGDRHIIIPGRNLLEAAKIMDGEESATEVEVSSNQIRFTTNNIQVQSALIEGEYPSLRNVIPQAFISEIIVETPSLLKAIERATVLASESIIRIAATVDTLNLLSQTTEIGDIQDEIPIQERSGEDFILSLNGKYFADILHDIDNKFVRLRYTGKMSPIVIQPLNDLSSTLFLLTPVRTAN